MKNPRNNKSQRAALNAIAMMPEKDDRGLLARMLSSSDEKQRASGGMSGTLVLIRGTFPH